MCQRNSYVGHLNNNNSNNTLILITFQNTKNVMSLSLNQAQWQVDV